MVSLSWVLPSFSWLPWRMCVLEFSTMRHWKEGAESFHCLTLLQQSACKGVTDVPKEKCSFKSEKEKKRRRRRGCGRGAEFLTALAWCSETGSSFISMPWVSRWKIRSLSGKTCSETPAKWFARVWLCVQVPASAACTALPDWAALEAFRRKGMPCLGGSRLSLPTTSS